MTSSKTPIKRSYLHITDGSVRKEGEAHETSQLDSERSNVVLTPDTSATACNKDPLLPNSKLESIEEDMSLQDLTTLVRNLGEQLASQQDAIEKLQTDNVAIQKDNKECRGQLEQLCAQQKLDQTMRAAQQGHVTNLDKLMEAKFNSLEKELTGFKNTYTEFNGATFARFDETNAIMMRLAEHLLSLRDGDSPINTQDRLTESETRTDKLAQGQQDVIARIVSLETSISHLLSEQKLNGDKVARLEEHFTTMKGDTAEILQRERDDIDGAIATLEASVKDLGLELRLHVARIQEEFKVSERSHGFALDSFYIYPTKTGSELPFPLQLTPVKGGTNPKTHIVDAFHALQGRVRMLERLGGHAAEDIEHGKDWMESLDNQFREARKGSSKLSNKFQTALMEIRALKSQGAQADTTTDITELREEVDSFTEAVSSLRVAQQDHRQALSDWSRDVRISNRNVEKQVEKAVHRIEALEQKSSWGVPSADMATSGASAYWEAIKRQPALNPRGGVRGCPSTTGGLRGGRAASMGSATANHSDLGNSPPESLQAGGRGGYLARRARARQASLLPDYSTPARLEAGGDGQ